MKEKWKEIKRYEKLYRISNMGRVKSFARLKRHWSGILYKFKERILKPTLTKDRRLRIKLNKYGKQKHFIISRLVATAFIPNPLNKPCVNHINNNPSNNNVNNLEWCTHKENMQHASRQGRMPHGESHHHSKLKEKDVINIRKEYKKHSRNYNTCTLAKKYKVDHTTIGRIITRKIWQKNIKESKQ